MTETHTIARRLWYVLEPLHAVVCLAPEPFEEAAALGYAVDTRWPSYFAMRSAPLGPVGPRTVTSAFYSFAPAMVAEYVPAAWSVADPERVLSARLAGVDRAYRTLFGEQLDGAEMAEAASLLRQVVGAVETAGRPLGAASEGIFARRGWSELEWAAATERLLERGWVDARGIATDRGREGRRQVERLTDELAGFPWQVLGPRGAGRLAQLLQPLLQTVIGSGLLPRQSTLGIGRVAA